MIPSALFAARALLACLAFGWCLAASTQDPKQETPKDPAPKANPEADPSAAAPPAKVEVDPTATDSQIRTRLTRILKATDWYVAPEVKVEEGVVFLSGRTDTDRRRTWAGDLARSTTDVVAVVNRIEVIEPPVLDFSPALAGIADVWRGMVRGLPWLLFAIGVIFITLIVAGFTRKVLLLILSRHMQNPLLSSITAFAGALFVFLFGLYLILRVAGLSQLAFTVLGGTGIVGIILGIGFREITENFLATLLLSWHNPFRSGDQVEINGIEGYVERMTARTTVLITLDGNHVQIPNALVYKGIIHNYSSNPNRREHFTVEIGYDVKISRAQDIAMSVLTNHPAVLADPEPWVLVDHLEPKKITLKIFFWLNGQEHSRLKVRSSIIRLVKRAFQDESIFPAEPAPEPEPPQQPDLHLPPEVAAPPADEPDEPANASPEETVTDAEGGLESEAEQIREQSRHARMPEKGRNLLNDEPDEGEEREEREETEDSAAEPATAAESR